MFFCVIITCRCSAMQQQTSETSKQNTVRQVHLDEANQHAVSVTPT